MGGASHFNFTSAHIINITLIVSEVTGTQSSCQKLSPRISASLKQVIETAVSAPTKRAFLRTGNAILLINMTDSALIVHPNEYTYLTYHLILHFLTSVFFPC